jgi:hypothetical protein
MNSNCIVVPLYKQLEALTAAEKSSLKQLYTVLGTHPIFLTGPASLNWEPYIEHAAMYNAEPVIIHFEEKYFTSVSGYNTLLLSVDFYKRFHEYKFMLIYHTDAYVFRDELEKWCAQDYDYIGSPWFNDLHSTKPGGKFLGVGNGGFSLRKTEAHIRILRRYSILKRLYRFYKFFYMQRFLSWRNFLKLAVPYHRFNASSPTLDLLFERPGMNEDAVISLHLAALYHDFKVAPVAEAIRFSFEVNPEQLYEMNQRELPFGCHRWEKYNPVFWSQFIA